jgi:hypothetical protein
MEVTLTDALKALGITENQVLSSRDAGDRFIVVTKPTGVKHTIMKVSIKPETTVANITEVTPAEAKPAISIKTQKIPQKELKAIAKKAVKAGIVRATKVIPITKKKATKKTTKKKK